MKRPQDTVRVQRFRKWTPQALNPDKPTPSSTQQSLAQWSIPYGAEGGIRAAVISFVAMPSLRWVRSTAREVMWPCISTASSSLEGGVGGWGDGDGGEGVHLEWRYGPSFLHSHQIKKSRIVCRPGRRLGTRNRPELKVSVLHFSCPPSFYTLSLSNNVGERVRDVFRAQAGQEWRSGSYIFAST